MKKLNLKNHKKTLIYISAFALYLIFLIVLVVSKASKTTDILGNTIIHFDRVAFSVFGRDIYFYALSIITGIIVAFLYANRTAKKIGFDTNVLFDGFIYGTILGILGARIYYAIFAWKSGGFNEDPLRIITGFFNEEGGLAIHGAVIAAGVFAYFYCKKKKVELLKLYELLFPGFLIGQILGRWGNFFNKEAHGGPISNSVSESRKFLDKLPIPKFVVDQMYIGGNYMHPTFLYESIWNLVGLFIIIIVRKKWRKYWYGDAFLYYLVWYGIGRFFVESLRTDYLPFNIFGLELRIAQVISVAMILSGVILYVLRRIYKYKPTPYMDIITGVNE